VRSTGWLRRYVQAAALIVPAAAVAAGVMTPAAAAPVSPVTAAAARQAVTQQAVTPADQFLGVSCPADRFCLGVGWYIPADGIKRPLAERWDGSAWHITFPLVPSPAPASVLQAVSCVSRTSCLAVGDTNTSGDHGPVFGKLFAETWNGRTWRMVPVADPGRATLAKVACASARSCFAVGYRTTVTGADRAISEHWNGTQWSYVRPRRPQPLSQLLGVSCPGPRNCWAAGWTGTRQAVSKRALIEHWNGVRWSTRPLPGTPRSSVLRSVACPARGRCTAVGVAVGFNRQRMLVEDLSGGRWHASVLSHRAVNPGNLGLDDVSCRARRVCSAVTRYISVANDTLTWAIATRGRAGGFRFQLLPARVAFDDPRDLSCSAHGCTLAGGQGSSDGRGDSFDIGSTLAWRSGPGLSFAPQKTPPPPPTAGGG
jgi:hypothetical protein